jgi:hypothetical protein
MLIIIAQSSCKFLVFITLNQFLIAKNAPTPVPINPTKPVIKVIIPFAVVIHSATLVKIIYNFPFLTYF